MARSKMAGTVLVTTHDLPLAGALSDGFRRQGYEVELFTPTEVVAAVDEPVLLVQTGGARTSASRRHARQAAKLGVPVFAVTGLEDEASSLPEVSASFATPADAEEIVLVGSRTIERDRLRRATGIVGDTDAMLEVVERIVHFAPVDATVLITGESGTGKELVARGIHALSRRRHRAFIPVNMAALSETLLESELFGHEKGSFTGAIDSRKGLFELADHGTIFLDEIGEMPLQTQTKLLRVLEQQEFHRVGGERLKRVDVRILAATNQELEELVAARTFRRDLFYRINVLKVELPPLRHRRGDIPRLVDAFIREASERHDRGPFQGIDSEAMEILARHRWPGNVRELRNLVESMVILAPGRRIRAEDIPEDVRRGGGALALVPTPARDRVVADDGLQTLRPQLELLFRTMMEMKVDIDDLRRDFEEFKAEEERGRVLVGGPRGEVASAQPLGGEGEPVAAGELPPAVDVGASAGSERPSSDPAPPDVDPRSEGGGVSTLAEMEREAVAAALRATGWNRRRAAEILGIGERTLYRKIRKYELAVRG
ncbi:MAG: sigma 54-interacting transcriptional regulator [Gemmatimonadetes bacterium]|nr:sigma 54-interacting transcriptional regulator [Gemmatimonadota bacterium]MCY3944231.1 sigma 54-interacting transcriptional regulator [Gemmatimonadota bacterium]